MPGLAILSPINESEELSPYRTRFAYARYPGQRSPIGTKGPYYNVQDTTGPISPNPEVTMDDLWIYDCYASEDAISPGGYSRSPSTPSHNRSISLPATTANYIAPNNIPLIKEPAPPAPHRPPTLNLPHRVSQHDTLVDPIDDEDVLEYAAADLYLPTINTAIFSPADYQQYSPLEQDAFSTWEVLDQLAAAVDLFSGMESVLSRASESDPPPEVDEDTVFWFIEALNLFVGDCTEVINELVQFSEYVQALLIGEHDQAFLPVRTLPRASFSERDMQEVLASAASIPEIEVVEALAELEASVPPSPIGQRIPREKRTSLKLSTNDAVLLQASMQPRARLQSVGALGRFSGQDASQESPQSSKLRQNRSYVIIGDETPVEDNWSAKSIVEFEWDKRSVQQQSPTTARPQPASPRTAVPRPLSSPVALEGRSFPRGRPPSLALSDPNSPRSSHSTSSSVSSLFSNLPRSSFTTSSSPRSSPRQSITFDKGDKSRFPTSSVKLKKMFTNMFKNRDGLNINIKDNLQRSAAAFRPAFGRRTAGTGSIDATLSALALGSSSNPLPRDRDPFAASPPPSAALPKPPARTSDQSALGDYSSMFASLKAASQHPPQPLFGGIEHET